MVTPPTSKAGAGHPAQPDDVERLGRRDLLVLRLELLRRRRAAGGPVPTPPPADGQRATRSTR